VEEIIPLSPVCKNHVALFVWACKYLAPISEGSINAQEEAGLMKNAAAARVSQSEASSESHHSR
jgi:hypothetical protein